PEDSTTSRRALASVAGPRPAALSAWLGAQAWNSTPTTLAGDAWSNTRRETFVRLATLRLGRPRIGRRKALAAFQRTPRRWFTSKYPQPKLSPRLKSSVGGI